MRLHEVIARAAMTWPDREAVVDATGRRTFAMLSEDIATLARSLRAGGISRGHRVAVAVSTSRLGITILYALSQLSAVAVPINTFWTAREVADVIRRSSCEYALTDEALGALQALVPVALGMLDAPHQPRAGSVHDVDNVEWSGPPVGGPQRPPDPPDVAMVVFTSGSSSTPKGALLTNDGLVGVAHYIGVSAGLTQADRLLLVLPLYHVGGIVDGFLAVHLVGGACVLGRFDAKAVLELFSSEAATFIPTFNTLLEAVFALPDYSRERHPKWRAVLADVSADMDDRLREAGVERIVGAFGMTECSSEFAMTRITQSDAERRSNRFIPLPGVDVRIADPTTGEPVGLDDVGEIRIKGWAVCRGYIDGSDGLDAAGYFCSGDLGRSLPGGAFCYEGRLKEVIKSGGENVSAREVETFMSDEIPEVRHVVVVGVPDARWGEMVVAFVEFESDVLADEDIRERCRGRLAAFKIPKRIVPVERDSWPMLGSGKIDRSQLGCTRVAR
jgi:acyl-CoA synthetase (AMP-forming)/AMP-acid ligase II